MYHNTAIALCATLLLTATPCAAAMRVAFTPQVVQSAVTPLGINLSDDAWHTGAAFTRERVRNGSFEGVQFRQITYGPKADAISYQDSFPAGNWLDVLNDARLSFVNGPARGLLQRHPVSTQRVADRATGRTTLVYSFAPLASAPMPFDGLLIEAVRPTGWLGQHGGDWWVFTSGEARVRTQSGDTPPTDSGKHIARLDATAGTADILAPLLDTRLTPPDGVWRLRFWSKGEGRLSIYLGDLTHRGLAAPLHKTVTLRKEWNYHELDFSLADYPHDLLALGFGMDNGTALLDDISMRRQGDGNPTVFRDALVTWLRGLAPGCLRHHQIGGSSLDNWLEPRNRRLAFAWSRQQNPPSGVWPGHPAEDGQAAVHDYGLHDFLVLCREVGTSPWICLPGTLTDAEARNVIEYLAGSVTTPYGMRRAKLGQARPWTSVFKAIHIEIGNEAWNNAPPFQLGGYILRGDYWQRLFQTMRATSGFGPGIYLHAGGQAVNAWFNRRIVREVPAADRLAIAPYLLHELSATTAELPADALLDYARGAAHHAASGWMAENMALGKPLSVYEVNYHVTGGDAAAAPRNTITGTQGGAVILADWLLRLVTTFGCSPVSLFTLQHPYTSVGNERVALWGLALSIEPGQERERPALLAMRLINRFLRGDIVQLALLDRPQAATPYQPAGAGTPAVAPLIGAYGSQEGHTRRLMLCNMDMTARHTVVVDGMPAGAQRTVLAAATFLADNEYGHAPAVQVSRQPPPDSAMVELPPASLTLLEWTNAP